MPQAPCIQRTGPWLGYRVQRVTMSAMQEAASLDTRRPGPLHSALYQVSSRICLTQLPHKDPLKKLTKPAVAAGNFRPTLAHPCPGDEPSHPRQPLTADACTSRDKDLRLLGRAAWLQHQRHKELKLSLWAEDGTRLRRANSTQRWLSDVIAKHPARVRIQEPTCQGRG